jgi:hypothetical protein
MVPTKPDCAPEGFVMFCEATVELAVDRVSRVKMEVKFYRRRMEWSLHI